jgi:hypothetical protein
MNQRKRIRGRKLWMLLAVGNCLIACDSKLPDPGCGDF